MCLAVPARVIEIDGDQAEVEIGGIIRRASLALCPPVRVGEYVLLHAGFAIQVVNEEEAEETLRLLQEIRDIGETG